MDGRTLKIAVSIMNGTKVTAACTCGENDNHAPGCAYELAVDTAWNHAMSQAEDIVQDVELADVA